MDWKTDMIKVSVIIPIYNVEQYIEECLLSAMHQTLKEIEIICVNDGTKDHSIDIVEKYAKEDSRIHIINKENGGLSSARNAGIQNSNGEYLYFLDSDDYISENMLEVLYHEVKEKDLDNIYFDAESFFENKELELRHKIYKDYYRRPSMFEDVVSGPELFAKMENLHVYRPSACLQMPKKSMILENGIRFYEGIFHEDNLFSLQTIFFARRVKHIATPFYKRRVREASIMTGGQEFERSYGYYVCISEFNKFLKGFDFQDTEILRAIKHRCYVMQSNAAKAVKDVSLEAIDESLSAYPMETQIEYAMLIKRLVEERQVQREKYDALAARSEKKMVALIKSTAYRTENAYFNNCKIENIRININGDISFKNCEIASLNVNNYTKDINLYIGNSDVYNFNFDFIPWAKANYNIKFENSTFSNKDKKNIFEDAFANYCDTKVFKIESKNNIYVNDTVLANESVLSNSNIDITME